MKDCLTIKEYDRLQIRDKRDLSNAVISHEDADALQQIFAGDEGDHVFTYKNRNCLAATQWVGIIELSDFSIEILPKLSGHMDDANLRSVFMQMLLLSQGCSSSLEHRASVSMAEHSFFEIIIYEFLLQLSKYVDDGLLHEYQRVSSRLNKVKGQIDFSRQCRFFLLPTQFFCRYSKYVSDNPINRFFRVCLIQMERVSRNQRNLSLIRSLTTYFDEISDISKEQALLYEPVFNSINHRVKQAYLYGRMFLKNLSVSLTSGEWQAYTMLFNMNDVYELFVYKVLSICYGDRVVYQKRGNYLMKSGNKRFINLRPDITYKVDDSEYWIIDTKWKIPKKFIKESDAYQMNAYSTGIPQVKKVILLYPQTEYSDNFCGNYVLLNHKGKPGILEIKTLDLSKCLQWDEFVEYIKKILK